MDVITIAKTFGLFFSLLGLGLVTNQHFFRTVMEDMIHHPGLQLVAAIVPLLIGSALVVQHPTFGNDWTILVTLLGYMILFAGAFRLLFNTQWVKMMHCMKDGCAPLYGGLFLLCYGISLLTFGFDLASGGSTWI